MPCSLWNLSSLTRDGTQAPALGARSLSHWTTKEVPCMCMYVYVCTHIHILFFARAFSNCSEWGLLFVAACRLLIVVGSLVAENRLWGAGFSSCSMRVQQLWAHRLSCSVVCGFFPKQGSNLSPALAGGFLSTEPPGKSYTVFFFNTIKLK